jgi:hypothetical protein
VDDLGLQPGQGVAGIGECGQSGYFRRNGLVPGGKQPTRFLPAQDHLGLVAGAAGEQRDGDRADGVGGTRPGQSDPGNAA